jgi:hypothetical protein
VTKRQILKTGGVAYGHLPYFAPLALPGGKHRQQIFPVVAAITTKIFVCRWAPGFLFFDLRIT